MRTCICTILLLSVLTLKAQHQDHLIYHDACRFTIIGKGFSDTEAPYDRLPVTLKDSIRKPLWILSKNSAGIAVRFRSTTTTIGIKWEVLYNKDMSHMAATGVRGIDLYALVSNHWQYLSTAKPGQKISHSTLISNMDNADREYMLYLPLYDGIVSLEIGIDSVASISNPQLDLPRRGKPIVFYGTSITQGGCASRPGMAYPSIIERKMNLETINLGFSGNGKMDWEILEAMLDIDASCYVIDCLANCSIERVNDRAYRFISRLLEEKDGIPVVLVEELGFTQGFLDKFSEDFLWV